MVRMCTEPTGDESLVRSGLKSAQFQRLNVRLTDAVEKIVKHVFFLTAKLHRFKAIQSLPRSAPAGASTVVATSAVSLPQISPRVATPVDEGAPCAPAKSHDKDDWTDKALEESAAHDVASPAGSPQIPWTGDMGSSYEYDWGDDVMPGAPDHQDEADPGQSIALHMQSSALPADRNVKPSWSAWTTPDKKVTRDLMGQVKSWSGGQVRSLIELLYQQLETCETSELQSSLADSESQRLNKEDGTEEDFLHCSQGSVVESIYSKAWNGSLPAPSNTGTLRPDYRLNSRSPRPPAMQTFKQLGLAAADSPSVAAAGQTQGEPDHMTPRGVDGQTSGPQVPFTKRLNRPVVDKQDQAVRNMMQAGIPAQEILSALHQPDNGSNTTNAHPASSRQCIKRDRGAHSACAKDTAPKAKAMRPAQ